MESKKKNILLGTLIVGVLAMTVAFAALATNLTINGTANVAATKWNIRFENWVKANPQTAGGHTNTAVSPAVNELTMQDNSNVTKVSGINVTLNQPGDIAKYTFEIANRGTIAAKLDNFTATDTSQNNLINYDVKCYESSSREGTAITTNYVLGVEQKVYCYVEVSYKDQTNSQTPGSNQAYHQDATSTSVEASWTWVQADNSNNNSGNSGNEPEPAVSWGNYITPTQEEGPTLPENSLYWIQQSGTYDEEWEEFVPDDSNYSEVCGVFSNGTVCLTNSVSGRSSDFADATTAGYYTSTNIASTGLQGYTLTKAQEMLTAGATQCIFDGYLMCEGSDVRCYIFQDGNVRCGTGTMSGCNLERDGYVMCQ